MASLREVPVSYGVGSQRAALQAVLQSRTFLKNPRLSALLEYLCERCFEGQADSIKEFNIATDVFGRRTDFDQSQDAIVRVEMHRLRKKLAEFYATEGQQEPIEIVIHSGHYLPEFSLRRSLPPGEETEQDTARDGTLWTQETPPARPAPRKLFWLVAGLLAAALAASLITLNVQWHGPAVEKRPRAVTPNAIQPPPNGATPPVEAVHMLCGLSKPSWRDRQGNVWGADAFFSGGTAIELPEQPVYRTRDSFLFRHMRTGEFSYKIPLKPGTYEMRLYFADPSYSPGLQMEGGEGTRVFRVLLNGEILLRDFDIIAEAGPNTADVRVFKDIRPASDGYLHLSFAGNQGAPLVNAIEIVPGIPHHLRPIRIVTQNTMITDRDGLTWSPDNYFLNGRALARSLTVTGREDPEIYAGERYGNFSYAIPVSDGRYRVALRFSENYWGPTLPGGGGVGTRIFDVYCNGTALLRNFDMLKEAGPHTQIIKTFHDLQPNAQGKLLLSFVPAKNYANLSAIEVVDESETRK